jgi:hypothetical protein
LDKTDENIRKLKALGSAKLYKSYKIGAPLGRDEAASSVQRAISPRLAAYRFNRREDAAIFERTFSRMAQGKALPYAKPTGEPAFASNLSLSTFMTESSTTNCPCMEPKKFLIDPEPASG